MKTIMDIWADDLEQFASLTYALTRPEIFAEYDKARGRESAVEDLGMALHSIIGLFAAKARSEVSDAERELSRDVSARLEAKFGVVDGGTRNE